jgi:hypothetical protein
MDLAAAALAFLTFIAVLAFTGAAAATVGVDSRFDHGADRDRGWLG